MRNAFFFVFLAASSFLTAQQPGMHADANPASEAEIKALEVKMADLIVRGEWDEYANHLAADYQHTRDNGRLESKDDAMANLRDAKHKIIIMEMEASDATVRTYGDTAIANAEFTVSLRESGQVKTRRLRQTDVFVKRDGQWWLIAEQDTAIGK